MANIGYAIGNNKWFLGQVPPCQNQHVKAPVWDDVYGDRVKVRIPGMHPVGGSDKNELSDDDLPWAIVAQPTTSGNRSRQSTGIWGGEWVIGFFMDEECQIPVITQILGNNSDLYEITNCINGTTEGKSVNPYNSGRTPNPGELCGGKGQKQNTKPSIAELNNAKKPVVTSVKNENGVSLAIKTESWDGGREKITAADYNKVFNSSHSTVTPTVKYNAAKAAVNSGVITQQQYQRSVAKLSRETEGNK